MHAYCRLYVKVAGNGCAHITPATVFSVSLYVEEKRRKSIKRAGFLSDKKRRMYEDRKVRGR